ncbi:DUF4974 domain-containing protein [Olivibacter jilunii]|uniref:DUF4974 domain-containing protein n=1 Tax=Olivibacter jilunii TaxID=985016 RepID=UPI00103117EA|nr:DUF4974 domain-containing protein [Olivibacter jilunii]
MFWSRRREWRSPGAAFDYERFVQLLLWSMDGHLDRSERAYIKLELKRNPQARDAWIHVQEANPGKRLFPNRDKRTVIARAVIVLALFGVGFGLYAKYRDTQIKFFYVVPTYRFEKEKLWKLEKKIEAYYKITVVFDDPADSELRFTGVLDSKIPLRPFLENLRVTSKIDYYYDPEGTLHFCKKGKKPK